VVRALAVLGSAALAAGAVACGGTEAKTEPGSCVHQVAARASGTAGRRLARIAREVERLRGLEFKRVPKPQYVNQDEMLRRLRRDFNRQEPARELEAAQRALVTVGAMAPGTDLRKLARNEIAGDIAGYYDPDTHALVVLSDTKRGLDAEERVTLAHELEHALADQRLGLPDTDSPKTRSNVRRDDETSAAAAALGEGDATLLTYGYAVADVPAHADDVTAPPTPGWSGLPYYIEATGDFPYTYGESFACHLFKRGGWKAVDAAYAKPPTTTAQILFPERYDSGEGFVDPPRPASPGQGWRQLDYSTLGAADLVAFFRAPGDHFVNGLSEPVRRAGALAGGAAIVWTRGPRTVVSMSFVERHGASPRLCSSIRAWVRAARLRASTITCSGSIVRASLRR
jgi:hypothetical protein